MSTDSVHSVRIYNAAPPGDQATSTMTWHHSQSHYPDTNSTSPCALLIVSRKQHVSIFKSLVWVKPNDLPKGEKDAQLIQPSCLVDSHQNHLHQLSHLPLTWSVLFNFKMATSPCCLYSSTVIMITQMKYFLLPPWRSPHLSKSEILTTHLQKTRTPPTPSHPHISCSKYNTELHIVVDVMNTRNIATLAGIEPTYVAFGASMLTITPPTIPDVITPTHTYLSIQLIDWEVSADY